MIQKPVLSNALSGGTALVSLFVLGLFLGKISDANKIGFGLKTLMAGLVAIAINFLLGAE